MRGEYLFVAEGSRGMTVYDIANIGNKGVSQRIVSGPFSPLGHDTNIASSNIGTSRFLRRCFGPVR